jgi:hypothetical protein
MRDHDLGEVLWPTASSDDAGDLVLDLGTLGSVPEALKHGFATALEHPCRRIPDWMPPPEAS